MAQSNLPPQAYTREVFAKAYDWLRTQPETIKKLASTPDEMVTMYLQARRHRQGGRLPEGTKSTQTFKSELKNLARGIEQFEKGEPIVSEMPAQESAPPHLNQEGKDLTSHQSTSSNEHLAHQNTLGNTLASQASVTDQLKFQASEELATKAKNYKPRQYVGEPTPPQRPTAPEATLGTAKREALDQLDARSLEMVKFVQSRFNLSSPTEALRMIIVLGYEKVCEIHPQL